MHSSSKRRSAGAMATDDGDERSGHRSLCNALAVDGRIPIETPADLALAIFLALVVLSAAA